MVFPFLPKCRKFIWWMKQHCFGGLQYGGFRLPPHALKIMWTGGCLLGLLTATCLRSFLWSGWDWKWPRAVVAVCSCSFMLQNYRREQFVILKDSKVNSNVWLLRLVVSSPGPKLMVIFGIVLMIRTSYPVPWVFTGRILQSSLLLDWRGNTRLEPAFTCLAVATAGPLGSLDLLVVSGSQLGRWAENLARTEDVWKVSHRDREGANECRLKWPRDDGVKRILACSLSAGEDCRLAVDSRRPLCFKSAWCLQGFVTAFISWKVSQQEEWKRAKGTR